MLLYAVPGYLLIRLKLLREDAIHTLVILLLYVNQVCLMLYSFQEISFSPEILQNLALTFLLSLFSMALMFGLSRLLLRRHYGKVECRIYCQLRLFRNSPD